MKITLDTNDSDLKKTNMMWFLLLVSLPQWSVFRSHWTRRLRNASRSCNRTECQANQSLNVGTSWKHNQTLNKLKHVSLLLLLVMKKKGGLYFCHWWWIISIARKGYWEGIFLMIWGISSLAFLSGFADCYAILTFLDVLPVDYNVIVPIRARLFMIESQRMTCKQQQHYCHQNQKQQKHCCLIWYLLRQY